LEITEHVSINDYATLTARIDALRRLGARLAVDDAGAGYASMTHVVELEPSLVKLDISLVQEQPEVEQGRIMAAVLAHAEATGATILAEGIETLEHLEQAQALGAMLGQGWYFGRPGRLSADPPCPSPIVLSGPTSPAPTPFSLVARSDRKRIGRKKLLLGMSRHLESLGHKDRDLVVLAAFQTVEQFTSATKGRYEKLGSHCPLVGALGIGMPTDPAVGVRGANLSQGDALAGEWTVVVVGSHYAGALIAKDCGDDGPEIDRRFEFVVSHDRALVLDAARSLLSRLIPLK